MNKFFKRLIAGFVTTAITLAMFPLAASGAVTEPNYWKKIGDAVNFKTDTWELGSTGNRLSKGWFEELDVSDITIGGAAPGGIGIGDGSAASPSLFYLDDVDSGFYRIGTNNAGLSLGGNKVFDFGTQITEFSGTESTGTGLIMKIWNKATVNSFAAIRLSVGAVEGTAGGTFFGSAYSLAPSGIANGMTLRPLSNTQDVGIAVGANVNGTGAGANFKVSANGNVQVGNSSSSTTAGRMVIDNSASTALNTVPALYLMSNASSTYALSVNSATHAGILLNAATGTTPFYHFAINGAIRAELFFSGTQLVMNTRGPEGYKFSVNSGGSSNPWLEVTSDKLSTWTSSLSTATPAITYNFATTGSGSVARIGHSVTLAAGSTTSGITAAGFFDNVVAGTGNTWTADSTIYSYRPNGNFGYSAYARGTTTGINTAVAALSGNANTNISILGSSTVTKNNAVNTGGLFTGLNAGTGTAKQFGLFVTNFNSSSAPTWGDSATLVADNATATNDILSIRDDSTEVFAIQDSGYLALTPKAATSGSTPLFSLDAPTSTGLTNTEYADVITDLDRLVTFTGGGSEFQYAAGSFQGSPSFGASSAQSVGFIANAVWGSVAHMGSNLTAGYQTNGLFIGDRGGANMISTLLVAPVGIETSVGNTDLLAGLHIGGAGGSTIDVGNQTATTDLAGLLVVDEFTYQSNTNVRTFTEVAGAVFNAPLAGSNVVFSEVVAVLVKSGDLRMNDGRLRENRGANITAATTITLGDDGNSWVVTGNTGVNFITTTGWNEGSVIHVYFTGEPTIGHNAGSPPANTAPILLDGGVNLDLSTTNGALLEFLYIDGSWIQSGPATIF